jgi:hypothetical protein
VTCTLADDAYLIAAFPGVVVRAPEKWLVAIVTALEGAYTVNMQAVPFVYDAGAEDDATDIRDGLVVLFGGQMLAAVSPVGLSAFTLDVLTPAAATITATGPAEGSITATLISGGDTNASSRAFWLARAECGLPPCCLVTCAADYTLMHAALAAHLLFTFGNLGGTGNGANDFESMTLGPASLKRGANSWQSSPADGDFAKTAPGQLYLMLRAKYVFPFFCG